MIPAHRWKVLREGCESNHPASPNEVKLLFCGHSDEAKKARANWSWQNDSFSTAMVSPHDWLDEGYFEETYYVTDIELRPADAGGDSTQIDLPRADAKARNLGGAPPKYDWAQAAAAVVFAWEAEGTWQPKRKVDVKRRLAKWFEERDQYPTESLLKSHSAWLFNEFQRRKD
jgi:hypothetical protein